MWMFHVAAVCEYQLVTARSQATRRNMFLKNDYNKVLQ
jgi:hypothetical protein